MSTRSDDHDQPEFSVAHFIFSPDYTSTQRELLLRQLSTLALPQYMCSAVIISLETLPIRSSSKVARHDISSLPILKDIKAVLDYTALASLGRSRGLGKRSSPAQCLIIKMLEQTLTSFMLVATRYCS